MIPKTYQETLSILGKYSGKNAEIKFFSTKHILAFNSNTFNIKDELQKIGFKFGTLPIITGLDIVNKIHDFFGTRDKFWYIEVDEMPNLFPVELDSKGDIINNTLVQTLTIDEDIFEAYHQEKSIWTMHLLVRLSEYNWAVRSIGNDDFRPIIEKYAPKNCRFLEISKNPYYNYIYQ